MPTSYYILALIAFIFGIVIHTIVYLWCQTKSKKGPALFTAGLAILLFFLNLIMYTIDLVIWINHHVKII